jgi:putative lipoic acid-binding regulatory protein
LTEEELNNFKVKLSDSMSFPGVYMFKFIVTSEHRNIALVENLFEVEAAEISTKESDKGKYISVTAKLVVMNVEEIIDVYRKAAKIKGIMFL